ncbi:hypothetical protein N5C46_19955 [Rossellomorea vietnamensis]|jgi:hypothetical protein|uniref:Uncharacterized protein n=1 Tax=Rossellomorea vietnamensis TaxID=218284 RepID=A0ACD4C5P7_9BACI|nr:hypothetical protein [Rossellomorea vietnamensis]UXH43885.1 hypothetical protein N5C46_19955 [Rossellomorea vietnamensis]
MKKRDPKEQFTYDENANQQVSQQIMDSYTSGVIDTENGQYGTYENEQYEE